MELVTAKKGENHITSENDADLYRGILGADSCVLQVGRELECELVSNNLLKIYDCCGLIQGRQFVIPAGQNDEITIENGTQEEKRIDLVVVRYLKNEDTGLEEGKLILVKGTPAATAPAVPAYTNGDIRAGDLTADMPLYEIELDGINVTEVRKVFKMCMTNADLSDKIEQFNVISSGELTMGIGSYGTTYGRYIKKCGKMVEIWINFGVSKQIPKSTKIATIPEGYWPGSAFYVFVPTGTKDYPINVNSNGVITAMEAIPADTIIRVHEVYFTK